MRRANRSTRKQRRAIPQSKPVPIPAPYGGLNTRDALGAMSINDAIVCDNAFPSEGELAVRPGYASHATGMGSGSPETIAEYQSGATRHMVVASNLELYNASAAGAATKISDGASPYSNNQWQWVNFDGVLQLVNGADATRQWDGTTMTLPAWTGTALTFKWVYVFKNRFFFGKPNDADFWYGAINAKSGALTTFPLSRVHKAGGYIVGMTSYTIDAGNGVDDFAVFIMSSGAVIVYKGTDPGVVADWSLIGKYTMPEPISVRGATEVGSDTMIVTAEDVVPLTTVLRSGFLGSGSKISGAIRAATRVTRSSFGWQVILHPEGRMLIINYPTAIGFNQWVMNTITGAWCRFKDIEASCWGGYNTKMYFGGTGGVVYLFDDAYEDDAGTAISVTMTQAWSNLKSPGEKAIAACQPVLQSDGAVNYSIDIGYDFVTPAIASPVSVTSTGSPWDTSPWDTSPWSAGPVIANEWSICSGHGDMVSISIRLTAKQDISWLRTNLRGKGLANL